MSIISVPNRPTLATSQKRVTIPIAAEKVPDGPRTVVVLGVERGGTSMVAGAIRAMGIPMGDRAGFNHEDPRFLTEDPERLGAYIAQRNQEHAVWGFKMPKASLNLGFFAQALRAPVFVVAYRNPVAIVDSWEQRGAGLPFDVMTRVNDYQAALNRFLCDGRHPVLWVNYERAVADAGAKARFVEDLAGFLHWPVAQDARARAVAMMSGDGGGYLDLPEHFLAIEACKVPDPGDEIPLCAEGPDQRDAAGWFTCDRWRPKLILGPENGGNLPQKFLLRADFEAGGGTDDPEGSLRIFFRYTEDFINAHCRHPVLRDGSNWLMVETSGRADALAIGAWRIPCRFRLGVRLFAIGTGGTNLVGQDVAAAPRPDIGPRQTYGWRPRVARWFARSGRIL